RLAQRWSPSTSQSKKPSGPNTLLRTEPGKRQSAPLQNGRSRPTSRTS
ncbi:uncharacterized protein METZ01_LOCUS73334, partial [marine metagenome]